MGKFDARVGYASASIGSDDLTEYYGHIGFSPKSKVWTKIYVSDIDSDNDAHDIQLIRFQAMYKF